jgi:hypothetical protein
MRIKHPASAVQSLIHPISQSPIGSLGFCLSVLLTSFGSGETPAVPIDFPYSDHYSHLSGSPFRVLSGIRRGRSMYWRKKKLQLLHQVRHGNGAESE